MGKMPPGQYKARIFSAPLDKKYATLIDKSVLRELAKHSVCKSFDFVVREAERGEEHEKRSDWKLHDRLRSRG
jgi:hypothetical protein